MVERKPRQLNRRTQRKAKGSKLYFAKTLCSLSELLWNQLIRARQGSADRSSFAVEQKGASDHFPPCTDNSQR